MPHRRGRPLLDWPGECDGRAPDDERAARRLADAAQLDAWDESAAPEAPEAPEAPDRPGNSCGVDLVRGHRRGAGGARGDRDGRRGARVLDRRARQTERRHQRCGVVELGLGADRRRPVPDGAVRDGRESRRSAVAAAARGQHGDPRADVGARSADRSGVWLQPDVPARLRDVGSGDVGAGPATSCRAGSWRRSPRCCSPSPRSAS